VNAFDRLAALPPTISTKAELDKRLAERAKAAPEHVPSPDGSGMSDLKSASAQSNEERIARLRASLGRSSSSIQHDQAQSLLHGYARSCFERER
jgi:hypothetical protein